MELIQRFDVWGPGGCRNGEVVGIQQVFWAPRGVVSDLFYMGEAQKVGNLKLSTH